MKERMRRWVPWIKGLIGLALLVYSLRQVDWSTLPRDLTAANPLWLMFTLLSILIGMALKIWRWKVLLDNSDIDLPTRRVAEAFLVGQATNILLPVRGGEIVRLGMVVVDRTSDLPQGALTIVLEKVLDLLAMVVASVAVIAYLPMDVGGRVRSYLLPLSGLVLVALLTVLIVGPELWKFIRDRVFWNRGLWMDRFVKFVDKLFQSLLWLRDLRHASRVLLLTLLIWITMWANNMFLFRALDLSLGASAGGLVLVLIMLGVIPALMPGNIGPFYFLAQLALQPFAVDAQSATVFAILLHALVTLPPLIGAGMILIFSEKLSFFIKTSRDKWKLALETRRDR